MRGYFTRSNLVSLALLLLVSWSGAPSALLQARQEENRASAERERRKKFRAVLERLFDRLEAELAKPGANPFDVRAKAAELGHDVEKIFAFVRDEIAFEPYAGILRGSRGVLMSRGGNSLEQAILLRDLLAASGFDARLVQGELPAKQRARLIDRFLSGREGRERTGLVDVARSLIEEEQTEAVCREVGLRPQPFVRSFQRSLEGGTRTWRELWDLTRAHVDYLQTALKGAKRPFAMDFRAVRGRLDRHATAHCWVEFRRSGSQPWIPMDPSVPGASVGKAFGPAPTAMSKAPARQFASLTMEVSLVREVGGKRERKSILSVTSRTQDFLYAPPTLWILPADPPKDLAEKRYADEQDLYRRLAGQKAFQPVLTMGLARYGGIPFDTDGRVHDVSAEGRLKRMTARLGGRLVLGGRRRTRSKLLGLSLKLLTRLPGRPPFTRTRTLYTHANRGRRSDGVASPVQRIDIFVQPHRTGVRYAESMSASTLLRQRGLLLEAVSGRRPTASRLFRFPWTLVALSQLREAAIDRISDERGTEVAELWETPFTVLSRKAFRMDRANGRLTVARTIDIVDNGGPFVPKGEIAGDSAAGANLELGVFSSVAEGTVLEQVPGHAAVDSGVRSFERERLRGSSWRVLDVDKLARLPRTPFSEKDRFWIAANAPGAVLLLPVHASAARTWWELDLETGSCVARVSGGGGQAATERAVLHAALDITFLALCLGAAAKEKKEWKRNLKIAFCLSEMIVGAWFTWIPQLRRGLQGSAKTGLLKAWVDWNEKIKLGGKAAQAAEQKLLRMLGEMLKKMPKGLAEELAKALKEAKSKDLAKVIEKLIRKAGVLWAASQL